MRASASGATLAPELQREEREGGEAPCPALIPACRGWGWVGRGVGGWVGFKWSGLCEAFEKLLDFDYAEGGEVVASPDSG